MKKEQELQSIDKSEGMISLNVVIYNKGNRDMKRTKINNKGIQKSRNIGPLAPISGAGTNEEC